MGVSAIAYIEKKDKESGKWVLTNGGRPVSSYLKFVFPDYDEQFSRIKYEDLSEELRGKYTRQDGTPDSYVTYYQTTLSELDSIVGKEIGERWVEINTIVKALGVPTTHLNNGEEFDWEGEDALGSELTVPVVKSLVIDLQNAIESIRNNGQREGVLLTMNDAITDYDCEHRVVVAVC